MEQERDLDGLLAELIAQVRGVKIPLSERIAPHVEINDRAVTRFGCCRYRDGQYTIEVARRVAQGPEQSLRETLVHELLHTCYGCRNHGKRWKLYAQRMSERYGYRIARSATVEELGVGEARPYRYLLRCTACGTQFKRFRTSALVEHPERYRCRCGGRLERVK